MIKIKRFVISNYRSCIKTRVDLLTDLSALIGINGVGKSNILNSFHLLKKSNKNRYFHNDPLLRNLSNTGLELLLDVNGNLYSIKATILYDTTETNSEEIYSVELKLKNMSSSSNKWIALDQDLVEYVDYVNRSSKLTGSGHERLSKLKTDDSVKIAVEIITYLTNISYYSATQFADPTKSPIFIELEDSRLVRSFRKSISHEQFLLDLYRSYKSKDNSYHRYLNVINKNGIGLIDDIVFYDHNIPISSLKVKAGGHVQKIDKLRNIVVPSFIIDGLNLSPNQLSEGTFKTLALVFYILNDESELLLIEEPEVCVHHGLLSSIIELIKTQSEYKQIIISTHSDYVLDKLAPENIILVKKERETGTSANGLSKLFSKNEFKALKEYLKNSGNLGEYWKEGGFENE